MHLYIDTIFFEKGKVAGEKRLITKSFQNNEMFYWVLV